MSWTFQPTWGENGSAAWNTNADGTLQRLVHPHTYPVKAGQTIYVRTTIWVNSAYTGDFLVGCNQLDLNGNYISTRKFTFTNASFTPRDTFITLYSRFTISASNCVYMEPFFEMPANAGPVGVGGITVSDFYMSTTSAGGTEYVGGTLAETIEIRAQIAEDLTTDNGVSVHPSSVPAVSVTQHQGSIDALALSNGPAQAGATNGATWGVNVGGSNLPANNATVGATWGVNIGGSNLPANNATVGATLGSNLTTSGGFNVAEVNSLNRYTANENIFPDGTFEDPTASSWTLGGGSYRTTSGSEYTGSTNVTIPNGGSLSTPHDSDILVNCQPGDSFIVSSRIYGTAGVSVNFSLKPLGTNYQSYSSTTETWTPPVTGWYNVSYRFDISQFAWLAAYAKLVVTRSGTGTVRLQNVTGRRVGYPGSSIVDFVTGGRTNSGLVYESGFSRLWGGVSPADTAMYVSDVPLLQGILNADGNGIATPYVRVRGDVIGEYNMHAQVFYDTSNTTYRLDPASTSLLHALNVQSSVDGDVLNVGRPGGANVYFYANGTNVHLSNTAGAGGARDGIIFGPTGVQFEIDASVRAQFTSTGLKFSDGAGVGAFDLAMGASLTNSALRFGGNGSYIGRNAPDGSMWYNTGQGSHVFKGGSAIFEGGPIIAPNGVGIKDAAGNGQIWFSGNFHIDSYNGNEIYLNYWSGALVRAQGILQAYGDMRAPIFYESTNTLYYVSPAETSNFNEILVGVIRDNTDSPSGYYLDLNGTSFVNALHSYDLRSEIYYDRLNTGYKFDGDGTTITNEFRVAGTIWGNNGSGRLYLGGNVHLDAYNCDLYLNYAQPGRPIRTYGDLYNDSYTVLGNNIQAYVYYERGNTGYYVSPAEVSYMNHVQATRSGATLFSNTPALELGHGGIGGAIGLAFHRNGQALNFGLDTDNIVKMGGWSWGDVFSWRGGGHFTAVERVDSLQFYNKDDSTIRWGGNYAVIRGGSPTLLLRDTDGRPAMMHNNSNTFYLLTNNSSNDTESWSPTFNGSWPLVINLTNNDISFGGAGSMVGSLAQNTSDVRLKENFRPITNAIDSMRLLRGWMYDWKVDFCKSLGYHPDASCATDDIGLRAQDVQKVYPQAVTAAPFDIDQNPGENKGKSRSGDDYLTVRYEKLVPALFAICNEQQDQIEHLTKLVNKILKEK
jgi:hypothetical protein